MARFTHRVKQWLCFTTLFHALRGHRRSFQPGRLLCLIPCNPLPHFSASLSLASLASPASFFCLIPCNHLPHFSASLAPRKVPHFASEAQLFCLTRRCRSLRFLPHFLRLLGPVTSAGSSWLACLPVFRSRRWRAFLHRPGGILRPAVLFWWQMHR